jgi:hypothetical protein
MMRRHMPTAKTTVPRQTSSRYTKRLQTPLLDDGRSWDAAKVTRHLFEKAFDLLSLRL